MVPSSPHLITRYNTQPTQIFLSETEITDYLTKGFTSIDLSCADVHINGIPQVIFATRMGHIADLYSLILGAIDQVEPIQFIWAEYDGKRAPVIILASANPHRQGKIDVPKDPIRIEAGRKLDSLDFLVTTQHPNRSYDIPIEFEPIYK